MRCKCCDNILNQYELSQINEATGDYEELCKNCIEESIDEDLDVGMAVKTKLPCRDVVKCKSSDALVEYPEAFHCFSCHKTWIKKDKPKQDMFPVAKNATTEFTLPDDYTNDIPNEGLAWLYKYRITREDIERCQFGYSPSMNRLIMPIFFTQNYLIGYQARRLSDAGEKYLTYKKDGYKFIRYWAKHDNNLGLIVITEDILSAIRVSKHFNAVALLGTGRNLDLEHLLSNYKNILVWLDPDEPGQQAAKQLVNELSMYTNVINVVSGKDPKCYSDDEIKNIIDENLKLI